MTKYSKGWQEAFHNMKRFCERNKNDPEKLLNKIELFIEVGCGGVKDLMIEDGQVVSGWTHERSKNNGSNDEL